MKKIIQTVVVTSLMLVSTLGVSFMNTSVALAACEGNQIEVEREGKKVCVESCGGTQTAILSCGGSEKATDVEGTGIWALLLLVLNIMTGLVGLAAVGGIVYASILYTTAQENSGQVTKAKETIFNVVLGLVSFALMYSFLQFIIPGGIFR